MKRAGVDFACVQILCRPLESGRTKKAPYVISPEWRALREGHETSFVSRA
jgi:hypothetical protein